jgi:hypothetical protein
MKAIFACSALAATLTLTLAGTASASDIFNFAADTGSTSSSYGNSLTFTESVGSMTVTATAWYLPANFTSSSTFGTAAMDNYNGTNLGLGICSPNDPNGAGCSSPYHQIDNSNGTEFVLFHFSQAVNLNGAGITVTNYAGIGSTSPADLTYYTASTGLTTSTTLSGIGSGTTVTQTCGTNCTGKPVTDTISATGTSSYLIVAAEVSSTSDGDPDAFKLNELVIPTGGSGGQGAVPEPGTMGTIALALSGFGLAAWRRRKLGRSQAV